ncbi:MAG: hypothetical protein PHU22_02240 [Eubacteriales bacterium]|nr:hypothetical protein [Eubacteriales bacterium]
MDKSGIVSAEKWTQKAGCTGEGEAWQGHPKGTGAGISGRQGAVARLSG